MVFERLKQGIGLEQGCRNRSPCQEGGAGPQTAREERCHSPPGAEGIDRVAGQMAVERDQRIRLIDIEGLTRTSR